MIITIRLLQGLANIDCLAICLTFTIAHPISPLKSIGIPTSKDKLRRFSHSKNDVQRGWSTRFLTQFTEFKLPFHFLFLWKGLRRLSCCYIGIFFKSVSLNGPLPHAKALWLRLHCCGMSQVFPLRFLHHLLNWQYMCPLKLSLKVSPCMESHCLIFWWFSWKFQGLENYKRLVFDDFHGIQQMVKQGHPALLCAILLCSQISISYWHRVSSFCFDLYRYKCCK